MKNKRANHIDEHSKNEQLETFRTDDSGKGMTTNQGLKVSEDEFSLKAGDRGPTLMEDFQFREKMTHFDHERIPERVVHARGYAAHGYFEAYQSLEHLTKAKFLSEKGKKTPVFVRFSTVVGFRGSADTVRDVRGFATKFYTEEGNYDLVGNNMPIFFIQDAIKFPDLVHAIKPEPHNEMPQASAAHDTFWDFVAHNQETAHKIMWAMSDRALPRSYRMMDGFSVHAFRFVNAEGKSHFVKFTWKAVLGVHSLVWDETQKIAGKDPDYNRRDLYEAIDRGDYPEYELGIQVIPEEDEHKFDFDLLDATKLWPQEDVPMEIVGKMTLDRNVDNVFAETEQVAFHPGHVVPGIDFSNDPLLQGRLFSYTDTQLIRLGGPNFHELPINRPVCPFHNNQRDGYHRQTINKGQVAYHRNGLANGSPSPVPEEEGGYAHYQEKMEGRKVRARSGSFEDHFSQARMFWNSMSPPEKQHIIEAFSFELGKCKEMVVRQNAVDMFARVDRVMAEEIAGHVGAQQPDAAIEQVNVTKSSAALSQEKTIKSAKTRKIGVLIGEGFESADVQVVLDAIEAAGAHYEVISETQGKVAGTDGKELAVDHHFSTTDPVIYDALYAVGGPSISPKFAKKASKFLGEAFDHFKPIGATHEGMKWLEAAQMMEQPGIITGSEMPAFSGAFIDAVAQHRFWERQVE
ncbi:catalase [Planomicrobium sp. YIM 101495]|uniref:catalase n=1 Tax=Planomicrobium sp. YIM 101495 TaxID=2665160 RepID=UPI0012B7FA3F|nr:catalase [Planomicrobium sp. YIM 101495]MTD30965.1 catalase [Planomicrobium sp. YIM 101495]